MKLSTLFEPRYSAACAIVLDDDKVLMGKATHDDNRNGKWCFPGGEIKNGETPEKAATRECKEETGISCTVSQSAFPHPQNPSVAFVICSKTGGKEKPNSEFSELIWLTLEEAKKIKDLYSLNIDVIDLMQTRFSDVSPD